MVVHSDLRPRPRESLPRQKASFFARQPSKASTYQSRARPAEPRPAQRYLILVVRQLFPRLSPSDIQPKDANCYFLRLLSYDAHSYFLPPLSCDSCHPSPSQTSDCRFRDTGFAFHASHLETGLGKTDTKTEPHACCCCCCCHRLEWEARTRQKDGVQYGSQEDQGQESSRGAGWR